MGSPRTSRTSRTSRTLQIRVLIENALEARGAAPASELTALVMGGGGTARAACYALRQMGMGSLMVYNRSTDKAETLAREFGGQLCPELHAGVAQLSKLDVLVSCVPGSAEVRFSICIASCCIASGAASHRVASPRVLHRIVLHRIIGWHRICTRARFSPAFQHSPSLECTSTLAISPSLLLSPTLVALSNPCHARWCTAEPCAVRTRATAADRSRRGVPPSADASPLQRRRGRLRHHRGDRDAIRAGETARDM